MVKCSILHCKNDSKKKQGGVSFHSFPKDEKILQAWIAATGKSDFLPAYYSRICSIHFDRKAFMSRKFLRPQAVPTLFLGSVGAKSSNMEPYTEKVQNQTSNPLACILNPETSMTTVKLNQECVDQNEVAPASSMTRPILIAPPQKIVSKVSSSNDFFQPSTGLNNKFPVNCGQNVLPKVNSTSIIPMQISVPVSVVQMQMSPGIQVSSQSMSTSLDLKPRESSHQTTRHDQSNSKTPLYPIKVVDMKKLLPMPSRENVILKPEVEKNCIKKPPIEKKIVAKPENKALNIVTNNNTISDHTTTLKIFHILNCLKVILPSKFNLSRLVPDEKISSLVVRYLKLNDNNYGTEAIVQTMLRIIIDAAKVQEKHFGDLNNHPYLKINNASLQFALAKSLPENFSMADVSDEILKCMCIILKQHIFTDGYNILRKKIHKFTVCDEEKLSEDKSSHIKHTPPKKSFFGRKRIKVENEKLSPNIDMHKYMSKGTVNMRAVLQYLKDKQCSAKDVLINFRLMFYLCRYLHIKSRQSNLQKLNRVLHFIVEKNIDESNIGEFEEDSFKKLEPPKKLNQHRPNFIKRQFENKLKLKPVVVLSDLINYNQEDMLFMTEPNRRLRINSYSYQPCLFSRQNISKMQNYTSEYVRKLTSESYKEFRKIVMIKNGDEAMFRLKYAKLVPGSLVFVKDFTKPFLGWMRGTFNKMGNFNKYVVQLDCGELWYCSPEQLRPLPKNSRRKFDNSFVNTRTHRIIKPKQLLDL